LNEIGGDGRIEARSPANGTSPHKAIVAKEPKTYRVGTLTYTTGALAMLFFWLLWGNFCFQLMESTVPSIMLLKFRALQIPNTVIGIVMGTIPGLFNMTLNPVISVKSDRCRSRWGRRIPFILFTLPFLVACLIGLAYSPQLAAWLQRLLGPALRHLSPPMVALIVLATLMTLFAFFNTFVNSVYWYLFNDVVPEHLLARFISWFRLVGMGAGSLYGVFLLKHADSHAREILLGAAVLYFFGFGLMCLKVKEGTYPPPDEAERRPGFVANIKTYARECMGLAHYWYVFIIAMGMATLYVGYTFTLYYNLSTGLTLDLIGKLGAISTASTLISVPISGWLADKYHPLRVLIVGLILSIVLMPLDLIWVFWQPPTMTVFWVRAAIATAIGWTGIGLPGGALIQLVESPLLMRILPRERYGQFCSAAAIFRSVSGILAGLLIGVYLDVLTAHWGSRVAYCLLPLWYLPGAALMLFFMVKLFRSWQRYGGDETYIAPVPGTHMSSSCPEPAVVMSPVAATKEE